MIREIESKADIEKRKKRNQWIIGGILIIVMLGSTFGYAISTLNKDNTNSNEVKYNGYTFVNQNDYWLTTLGNYQFAFKYNPTQVEKVTNTNNLSYISSYSGKPLYIFSEDYTAKVEVYMNLIDLVQRWQDACPVGTNCTEDWPIKDCSNNFIIIRANNENEESRIYQNESCVFIEGPPENLTQMTDEFLFRITGIKS